MKKSKFTDSQIHSILKQAEGGTPVSELCGRIEYKARRFMKTLGFERNSVTMR